MNNTVKKTVKIIFILFMSIVFLIRSESAAEGISESVKLCVYTVVPSLLPFMVLSSYLIKSGALSVCDKLFSAPCRTLFGLPGKSACIIIMSIIGGFPVGANMIASSVENGMLNKSQGRRMMFFCVNAGPAFVINAVGVSLLNSKKAGIILFVSMVISSLITGMITKLFDKSPKDCFIEFSLPKNTGNIVKAVEDSVKAMISVCGWILVFGSIRKIICDLQMPHSVNVWAEMVFEVTSGCNTAAHNFPLPVLGFVLGFSGFAVHAQLLPCLEATEMKYSLFFASRAVSGAMCCGVAGILFNLFPCDVQVFASSVQPVLVAFSVSGYASAAAIFTVLLIILDLAPVKKM